MDVAARAHRLFFHGMLLVMVGLVVGLVVPAFANPRMGLSAHTSMLMNGVPADRDGRVLV
jgi:hydroxylaminobenzene mutase